MGNSLLIGIAAIIILIAFAGMLGIIFFSSGGADSRGTLRPASGRIRSEQRLVEPVHAVSVTGDITLRFRQGEAASCTLTGDDDILARVRTQVRDGVLLVDYDEMWQRNRLTPTQPLVAELTLPALASLVLTGESRGELAAVSGDMLDITLEGSSTAQVTETQVNGLTLSIDGRCEITLDGQADTHILNASGMAQVDAAHLQSRRAQVSAGGMCQVTVWAVESLAVTLEESPRVQYYGDPALDEQGTGNGVLLRLGSTP